MTIPQLFIADKLVASHGPLPGFKPARSRSASLADSIPQVTRANTPLPPSSLQSSCTFAEDPQPTGPLSLSPEQELDPLPFATETVTTVTRPAGPPSYKSALQAVQPVQSRASTPELDAAGSSASSDTSDEPLTDPCGSPSLSRARHVNPNIVECIPWYRRFYVLTSRSFFLLASQPLSKHKPPPCTLFYLANCKHGADCKYGHDYILEDEHYETIRENAKKAPCPAKNRSP
jgi:hypothetical protein